MAASATAMCSANRHLERLTAVPEQPLAHVQTRHARGQAPDLVRNGHVWGQGPGTSSATAMSGRSGPGPLGGYVWGQAPGPGPKETRLREGRRRRGCSGSSERASDLLSLPDRGPGLVFNESQDPLDGCEHPVGLVRALRRELGGEAGGGVPPPTLVCRRLLRVSPAPTSLRRTTTARPHVRALPAKCKGV